MLLWFGHGHFFCMAVTIKVSRTSKVVKVREMLRRSENDPVLETCEWRRRQHLVSFKSCEHPRNTASAAKGLSGNAVSRAYIPTGPTTRSS